MTYPRNASFRSLVGATLTLVVMLTAACGSATTPPAAQGPDTVRYDKVRYDAALHDQLPQAVRDRGVLRIGTDASYAPMSSFADDGRTIVGMEPDLATEIGKVLGVRVEFVNTSFTALLDDVASGGFDLGMSAMTDTPQRAKVADFVNYFSAGTAIVVQSGNPDGVTGISDLCGKAVAVERGTTQVDLLARVQRNCVEKAISVQTYPTNSDALVQLRTGRVSAVLNDLPPAVFVVNDPGTRSQYQLASTATYEPGLYGIVVAKDEPGLRTAVQGAAAQLLGNGVYGQILERWDVSSGAIDRISVNSDR